MGDMANRIPVAAGMILLGGLCGWRSARLALGTTALGLTRDDAEYHFREWQEAEAEGRPQSAELDRALALNPRHTEAWIARGLGEEAEGDRRGAEATLLHAAEIDRTYLPRWTLASFYLRHGDPDDFWIWARRAAEMAYDPGALFQLCWRTSGEAQEILERAIPAEPGIRRAYFDFLVRTKRLEAARPLGEEIGRTAGTSDKARLLEYCDAEITDRRVKPAIEAWNALALRRVIPYGAVDPAAGVSLTNGDFSAQPLMQGFDWRAPRVEGASLSFDTAAHEMALSLEGRQSESCDFVEQYAPVVSGAPYCFRYRFRTRDLAAETGLGFSLLDARRGEEFAAGAVPASSGDGSEGAIAFSTPAGCEMVRIQLRYRRPPGSTRAEGSASFTRLTLELLSEKVQRSKRGADSRPAPLPGPGVSAASTDRGRRWSVLPGSGPGRSN
jgi:tetratricopeptide (TPR) repeat protein